MQYNHTSSTSLADAITRAERAIDAAAGETRAKYLTIAPGQEATYVMKSSEAALFKTAGYPADLTTYPWVQAEVNATGLSAAAATDAILLQKAQWEALGSYIEQLRLAGKAAVRVALTVQEVAATRHQTVAALGQI